MAVFAGLLVPSLVLFRQVLGAPGQRLPGGSDGVLFSWWLGWVPHAIAHGHDPLITSYLNAPDGVNGMWTTSVPALGLLAAPVTALAGPVVAMNVLFVLAPALSGWACWAVVRRWVSNGPAALAGLLYGYSPYLIGASHGHLHLSLALFPPLVLGLVDDLIHGRRSPHRVGLLLGAAAGVQFYVAGELLVSTMLVLVAGLALLAVLHRDRVRRSLAPVARGLGLALAILLVLALPGLIVQFLGPGRVVGAVQTPGRAVTDLLGFVVPGSSLLVHTAGSVATVRHFTGPSVELGGYLGAPLLLLAVYLGVRYRREPLPRFVILLAALVGIGSLGPHLHVGGHVTGIVLPWRVLQALPVTEQLLPSRLSVFVLLLLAVALAWWLDRCLRREWLVRAGAVTVAAVVALTLCPGPTLTTATSQSPRFFTTDAATTLPEGSTVLVVPYAWAGQPGAMLWQSAASYRFRLVGGYFTGQRSADGQRYFNAPPSALNLTLIALVQGRLPADVAQARLPAVRTELATTGASRIVLGPCGNRAAVRAFLTELAGAAPQPVADVDVWTVRS